MGNLEAADIGGQKSNEPNMPCANVTDLRDTERSRKKSSFFM